MLVADEWQINMRQAQIELESLEAQKNAEEASKNRNFTQIYSNGWKRIRELAKGNPGAIALYSFFAENIDPTCGAVVADQQFLANQMNVSTRTIRTWLKYLEDRQALVRIPIAGRVCAYALDPREVWKGYNNTKDYAAFNTKTLVNKEGDIKRRIMSMFSSDRNKDNMVKKEIA